MLGPAPAGGDGGLDAWRPGRGARARAAAPGDRWAAFAAGGRRLAAAGPGRDHRPGGAVAAVARGGRQHRGPVGGDRRAGGDGARASGDGGRPGRPLCPRADPRGTVRGRTAAPQTGLAPPHRRGTAHRLGGTRSGHGRLAFPSSGRCPRRGVARQGRRAGATRVRLGDGDRTLHGRVGRPRRPGSRSAQRAWLRLRLGLLLRYTNAQGALALLEEARRSSAGTSDALLVATATCYAGHLRCWSGDLSGGVRQMAEGVAALNALPFADRARFDRLLADGTTGVLADNAAPQAILAQWLAISGRYADARQAAEAVLALEPDSNGSPGASPASFYDAYHALGYVHSAQGRPEEARRYWRRSQTSLRAIGHHVALHQQLYIELSAAALPYQTDRLADRTRLAAEVDAARRAARGVWREDDEPACLALWFIEGRWTDIRGAVSVASRPLIDVAENPAVAALARAEGDVTLAWQLVREELPHGPNSAGDGPALPFRNATAAPRVQPDTRCQRSGRRIPLARSARPLARLVWCRARQGRGHLAWAAYHRAAGDPEAAGRRAEQSLAGATTPRQPLVLLAAHRFLGERDTKAGRYPEAGPTSPSRWPSRTPAPRRRACPDPAGAGETHWHRGARRRPLAAGRGARPLRRTGRPARTGARRRVGSDPAPVAPSAISASTDPAASPPVRSRYCDSWPGA